jgi:AP-1 complex subunit beta-1
MCLENGFLETLQEMIGDPNPMVVANSVTALVEINESAPETKALRVTSTTLKKMLMALSECTEWGRVTILTTLADYKAQDVKESEHICERIAPQFQHANPSVVLAAVKVVFLHMRSISQDLSNQYLKKMAPPLGMCEGLLYVSSIHTDSASYSRRVCSRSSVCCTTEH